MNKFFITTLLAALASTGGAAPADEYRNISPATTLPQVDATTFINLSSIDLITTLPWRAQNVQYWTNAGIMSGSPGFQFQYDRSGKTTSRRVQANSKDLSLPSVSFHNDGNISAFTTLSIKAKSIYNSGRLDTDETGRIIIQATNGTADLSRSGIRVGPPTGINVPCGFESFGTNFTPDPNIRELYWGAGRNNNLGTNGQRLTLTTLSFANGGNLTLPFPFTLTARADQYLCGRPDLAEVIRRAQAFQTAGATAILVPGLTDPSELRTLCDAIDLPVVALIGVGAGGGNRKTLEACGARRIGIGGAMVRVALSAFTAAARDLIEGREIGGLSNAMSGREISDIFQRRLAGS